jgi:hypothetical protein
MHLLWAQTFNGTTGKDDMQRHIVLPKEIFNASPHPRDLQFEINTR